MKRLVQTIACATVGLILGADLGATTVQRMSNRDLALQAEAIMIGTVSSVRAAWEGRTLVTLATVAVRETLKGAPVETATIALPGGVDANRKIPIAMTYAGAPTMKVGEDVFLFLAHDDNGGYTVLGFSQGKFSVVRDPAGRQLVSRDLTTITLHADAGIAPGTLMLQSLSEFKEEILGYVR